MKDLQELQDRVRGLAEERNAVLLVHYYQTQDIQQVADHLGDSLELALQASRTDADIIVFAGVDFMAETAKLVNPGKMVLHPNTRSQCPMAAMVDPISLRKVKERNPGVPVVAYVNTSAAVKAESDICCTSANAVQVVESLDTDRIIFVPETLIHPEAPPLILTLADFVGSTRGISERVSASPANEFIIGTEEGLVHHLRGLRPDAEFHVAPPGLCPNMKRITLLNIQSSLENLETRVQLDDDLVQRARRPVDLMLKVKRRS
jgi:quinolinate synthase